MCFKKINPIKFKFIIFISAISFLILSGCVAFIPQAETTKVDAKPIVLRKKIKDIDYRNLKETGHFRKRLVILPFLDSNPNVRTEESRMKAREAFIYSLNQMDDFIVIDSEQLKIDPKKYIVGESYDLTKLATELDSMGVNAVLEGQIVDVKLIKKAEQIGLIRNLDANYEVVVKLKMMNVRTKQEIYHTQKTVTLEEKNTRIAERVSQDELFVKNPQLVEVLIKDAFLDFSPQIQQTLSEVKWEGRIAAVRGEKYYVNVGQISGVQIGDLLRVIEDSSEVYDSEMGYHLGKVEGKVKGTLEIISYFGQDGAVGVLHSGAGFKESDRIEAFR